MASEQWAAPWHISSFEVNAGGDCRTIMGADNFSVAYISGRTRAEHEAIAALVTAAPDMAEAIAAAVKCSDALCLEHGWERVDEAQRVYDMLTAAHARATGAV